MLTLQQRFDLKSALRETFPMPKRIERLVILALSDLHNGPVRRSTLDSEDARVWSGFESATREISRWLAGNVPSVVWFDADCGSIGDREPEGYRDEETGEWFEPFTEDTYRVESREIRRLMFGELGEYL